jgi:hypothetical protein
MLSLHCVPKVFFILQFTLQSLQESEEERSYFQDEYRLVC